MKKENESYLFENFPLLYRRRERRDPESLMCYGFSCGDGWFEILKELSEKLERELAETEDPNFVVQVKEKFGELCFYMNKSPTGRIRELIEDACERADATCEWCGQPGIHDRERKSEEGIHRWIRTLCDGCAKKRDEGYRPWEAHGS